MQDARVQADRSLENGANVGLSYRLHGWEWECLLLAILAAIIYGTGASAVPIRGEESRWARVAWEMLDSGDWIASRQQGQLFPDRPPLNSWCIAAASVVLGDMSALAVRLPTLLATILTSLLVYVYARSVLGRGASFTAGLIYATFPQILQLGRFAESDAILTFLVTASLFVWHLGVLRGWSPWIYWSAGYFFAALAALTKGPQGPIYFVGAACLYLVLRRDWRRLFAPAHVLGVITMLLVIGAWQIPFSLSAGVEASFKTWSEGGTLAERLAGVRSGEFFTHVFAFPLEILAVMLPWAFFVPALATRDFWRKLHAGRDQAFFLLTAVLVVMAPCWIVPSARVRYVMAMFPAAACLIALAVEHVRAMAVDGSWRSRWTLFQCLMAAGIGVCGVAALAAACLLPAMDVQSSSHAVVAENFGVWVRTAPRPPVATLAVFGAISLAAAAAGLWFARHNRKQRAYLMALPTAVFLSLGYDAIVLDYLIATSPDAPAAVAKIKSSIPAGESLASFGPINHLFTYSYRGRVELKPWPLPETPQSEIPDYFCFMRSSAPAAPTIPVPWEELGTVVCDRYRMADPREVVVVGHRLPSPPLARLNEDRK